MSQSIVLYIHGGYMSKKITMLETNQTYDTDIGIIVVHSLLGAGTQGEVYHITLDQTEYALKVYFPDQIHESLLFALQTLIDKGSPNKHFLWPKYLIKIHDIYGYVMPLIGKEFKKFTSWVTRDFDMNMKEMVKAAIQMTDAFHQLHARGLSYQDISLNNMMINPLTGDILIIDNDNVTTNQESINGVYGTPKFMAPEIIEKKISIPNADTDRFSLAILLFYFLMIGHPFHGKLELDIKCFDDLANKKIYGFDAVFIFDPNNKANRPDQQEHRGVIALWDYYPNDIKELFIRAFTDGVKNPSLRPREKDFKKAFISLEASLYQCVCGRESIYDVHYYKINKKVKPCPCGNDKAPSRIKCNDMIFALDHNKSFTDLYLNIHASPDESKPIISFKKQKLELKLKIISEDNITKTSQDGMIEDILPEVVTMLSDGDQLHIKGNTLYVKLET